MADRLNEQDLELFHGPNFGQVVTLNADGTPQITVLWVDADDDHILINTAEGRAKDVNLRRDPRVAVSVVKEDDWYDWVAVNGTVVERVTGPEADAHIDALSRKYDEEAWTAVEGQVRVLYRIRPDTIVRYR